LWWIICMTLDCVIPTQSSVIQTIHCNVGLKCLCFSILPKCLFVIIVVYVYLRHVFWPTLYISSKNQYTEFLSPLSYSTQKCDHLSVLAYAVAYMTQLNVPTCEILVLYSARSGTLVQMFCIRTRIAWSISAVLISFIIQLQATKQAMNQSTNEAEYNFSHRTKAIT